MQRSWSGHHAATGHFCIRGAWSGRGLGSVGRFGWVGLDIGANISPLQPARTRYRGHIRAASAGRFAEVAESPPLAPPPKRSIILLHEASEAGPQPGAAPDMAGAPVLAREGIGPKER